jgi:hypothetical protein
METIYYIKDNNVYLPDCRDKHRIVIVENEPNFQSREHFADYIPVRIQINVVNEVLIKVTTAVPIIIFTVKDASLII